MSPNTRNGSPALGSDALSARLRITPPQSAGCALLEAGSQGEGITRNVLHESNDSDGSRACRATVTLTDDSQQRRRLVRGEISNDCVCPMFSMNDCVVDIECFKNGTFFVNATVPDREALRDLIDDLREKNASVHLEQLLPIDQSEEVARTVELDTSEVTQKQLEAIEAAVQAGYYERPRRTDLSDLSTKLGISESAVSQRLNGAESTLIREIASANGNYSPR